MQEVRSEVLKSAHRAAEKELELARKAAHAQYSKLHSNGAAITLVAEEIGKGFEEGCAAAANRIAEIEGARAIAYASALEELLRPLSEDFLAVFSPEIFGPNNLMARMLGKAPDELRRRIARQLDATVADLKLGIADGVNVDKSKSRIISIDNRQGSGQFVLDSKDIRQSVGRDLRNDSTLSGADEIVSLLKELRTEIARGEVSDSIATDLDDAALAVERELEQPSPDPTRVRRLLLGLGKFSKEVAAAAVGHTIAGLVLAAGHISG